MIALLQAEIATEDIINYLKSISGRVSKFKRLSSNISNENLQRQLHLIPSVGYELLSSYELRQLYAVTNNMSEIYRKTKLCDFYERSKCDLRLIPTVQNIIHTSKNTEEIEYYWREWRQKTGVASRKDFEEFLQLYRRTATMNGIRIFIIIFIFETFLIVRLKYGN